MDDFRQCQKVDCGDGTQNKRDPYGCPCCRKLSFLRHFKQMSRKRAKARLREQTKKLIQEGKSDE